MRKPQIQIFPGVTHHFSLAAFRIYVICFCFSPVQWGCCWACVYFLFTLFGTDFLESVNFFLPFAKFRRLSAIIPSNIFFYKHLFSSPPGTLMIQMLDLLILSHRFLGLIYFLIFNLFPLCAQCTLCWPVSLTLCFAICVLFFAPPNALFFSVIFFQF